VLGLTGYLYNAIMVPYGDTLNNPATFNLLKIPLLGDIPVFGVLFKNINETKVHNEVVFLITPHIINERQ